MEKTIDYKSKKELYKKLGAPEFQKLVFSLENTKFKIMKKCMPNFTKRYDKAVEIEQKKRLKKAKTEEEIREINKISNYAKMDTHREYNRGENRNYHINKADVTEIYRYLERNKKIHQNGLIRNAILGTIWISGIILLPEAIKPYLIATLTLESINAIINFECINLQNYNICRYKLAEEKIIQREKKRVKSEINDYGDAAKLVHEKIVTEEKLPSMSEIIDSTETTEQLEQLKKVLLREKQRREEEKQKVLLRTQKNV